MIFVSKQERDVRARRIETKKIKLGHRYAIDSSDGIVVVLITSTNSDEGWINGVYPDGTEIGVVVSKVIREVTIETNPEYWL